jgi:hypothetical protein
MRILCCFMYLDILPFILSHWCLQTNRAIKNESVQHITCKISQNRACKIKMIKYFFIKIKLLNYFKLPPTLPYIFFVNKACIVLRSQMGGITDIRNSVTVNLDWQFRTHIFWAKMATLWGIRVFNWLKPVEFKITHEKITHELWLSPWNVANK